MGRPPNEMGGVIKKGSWSPEEDLLLLSYVHENGPGDWKSVPKNTGLQRCSKSCRLRWKNYLRPDIKRGDFTAEEDRKIINLQALLGNRWAAIAHYLPYRTDIDIKNYWNTRLKKKVNEVVSGRKSNDSQGNNSTTTQCDQNTNFSNVIWARGLQNNMDTTRKALIDAITVSPTASTYNLGVTTHVASPVMRSTLVIGTPPLQTSSLESFDSAHGWKMNDYDQDLLINTNDYRLSSNGPAPIDHASNYSITSHPSSVENIAQLLQGWYKELPNKKSVAGNIFNSMNISSPINGDQKMMNHDIDNVMIPLFTSTENSMLPYEANSISPPVVVAYPFPPAASVDPFPPAYIQPFPPTTIADPFPPST